MNLENNSILSQIFKEMSAIYQYFGGLDRFRAFAYGKAAKVIASLPEEITLNYKHDKLKELPGIGEGIAEKIEEYLHTGKIEKYEQLKKSAPIELLGMMEVKGFGPRSLKRIHEELKIATKSELIRALQDGTISKMKSFGPKKVENMLRGLKLHKLIEERLLLWDALQIGENLLEKIRRIPQIKDAELAGSLRRRKETIGDIDILVSGKAADRKLISDQFAKLDFVKQILAKGETKTSILLKGSGKQVDLRIVNEDEWGSALQYFTGSREHNIHLRSIAKEKGYKISEYGLFKSKGDVKIAGAKEEEIYKTLGFQFIPPELREDKGEIERARKKQIPELITIDDIKGDLQMHSNWSDGINTLEEIVNHIRKNYSYEYIAFTDHSVSSRIANGMDEKRLLKQIRAIEDINKNLGEQFVKTGIEVDIHPDGKLDISDEILSRLDWVTASIHSNFNRDNTDRIIRACENPYVSCIGHPTGRLLGSREAYPLHFDTVFEAGFVNQTAFEINAQPERMDLNEELIMKAVKKGVKLVISTDSHSLTNFSFMKLGVFIARRGWCRKKDILNTKSWKDIELFRKRKTNLKHLSHT
jgi:DNA polymerase (family 10)